MIIHELDDDTSRPLRQHSRTNIPKLSKKLQVATKEPRNYWKHPGQTDKQIIVTMTWKIIFASKENPSIKV